jgi:hypothetical protein
MTYRIRTRDEHFKKDGRPKRILALDGGGLRGILTLGILQRVEDLLRERHGAGKDFRLAHYYDLIVGTSTGAIIAATLALGWSVEQIRAKYMDLGQRVFERSWLRQGLLRAKYDERKLIDELKNVYGERTTIGDAALATGLLVVTKRLDTGSPWPIGNNPEGKYFGPRPNHVIGNRDYPLWKVVRASTAAPSFFDPERITICQPPDGKNVVGEFVDGGVSPHNNPSLMALMYATLKGYRVEWPTGPDAILLTSVGTGTADPEVERSNIAAQHALKALLSLMQDASTLNEMVLQWLGGGPRHRKIDSEIDTLANDSIGGGRLLTYVRYNVDLLPGPVQELVPSLKDLDDIAELSAMDAPENMTTLHSLGVAAGKRDVQDADFPKVFDLPA